LTGEDTKDILGEDDGRQVSGQNVAFNEAMVDKNQPPEGIPRAEPEEDEWEKDEPKTSPDAPKPVKEKSKSIFKKKK
jgi:hypothetical protein